MGFTGWAKASSICVILIGIGHLATYIGISADSGQEPEIVELMRAVEVTIVTPKTLYDFHQGFSFCMGVLLLGLGVQQWLAARQENTPVFLSGVVVSVVVAILSAIYFHLIAISFMVLASVFGFIALGQPRNVGARKKATAV